MEPQAQAQSANHSKIHWQTPVTMISAEIAGVLLSAGHHFFYYTLHGQNVDKTFFDQEANIAIGTAISYLVRASLGIAVSTAYWQIFWQTLIRKSISISAIDSLGNLLGSLPAFIDIAAFRVSPAAFSLAAIFWLLPLSAVFPPASLTVSPVQITSHKMHHVPRLNFDSGPLATVQVATVSSKDGISYSAPQYVGPSQPLSRLAATTVFQGQIPSIPPPVADSPSYTLRFDGPSMRCRPAAKNILQGLYGSTTNTGPLEFPCQVTGGDACPHKFNFLSWTPSSTAMVPFRDGSSSSTSGGGTLPGTIPISYGRDDFYFWSNATDSSYLRAYADGPGTLFVAVNSNVSSKSSQSREEDWTVTQCTLWNTSYTVDFSMPAGSSQKQSIVVTNTTDLHPVKIETLADENDSPSSDSHRPYNASTTILSRDSPRRLRLSYQAMMECLGHLLVGQVSTLTANGEMLQQGTALQTDLAYTREMFPLYNHTIATAQTYEPAVRSALASPQFGRPVAGVLEDMFQNMTLALFSQDAFVYTDTLPSSSYSSSSSSATISSEKAQQQQQQSPPPPPLTNVTIRYTTNTYVYSPLRLLLSYGSAVGLSLIPVIFGLASVLSSAASYSNKFSTVMRTTCHDPELCEYMVAGADNEHGPGADPLPEELGRLRIRVGGSMFSSSSSSEKGDFSGGGGGGGEGIPGGRGRGGGGVVVGAGSRRSSITVVVPANNSDMQAAGWI